jgi:hypothetical protein
MMAKALMGRIARCAAIACALITSAPHATFATSARKISNHIFWRRAGGEKNMRDALEILREDVENLRGKVDGELFTVLYQLMESIERIAAAPRP